MLFANWVSEANITVIIHPDLLPELNEVTVIEMTEITENGVLPGADSTRGARLIPSRTQSFITVQANDAPHGVIVWSANRVTTTELDAVDSTVRLTILREFGSIGAILISYRYIYTYMSAKFYWWLPFSTFTDTNVPVEDQATSGIDYLPTSSNVMMAANATSTTVMITILHVSEYKICLT